MTTPFGVIAEWLQAIPPTVRKVILLVFALAVIVVQVLQLLDVSLDYEKINEVLAIIGGYLGFQSAANVPASGDAERPLDVDTDQPPVAPPIEGDEYRAG